MKMTRIRETQRHFKTGRELWISLASCAWQEQRFTSMLISNLPGMVYRWVWEQGWNVEADNNGSMALEGFITDITDQKETKSA